jgi:hypothetical protein
MPSGVAFSKQKEGGRRGVVCHPEAIAEEMAEFAKRTD